MGALNWLNERLVPQKKKIPQCMRLSPGAIHRSGHVHGLPEVHWHPSGRLHLREGALAVAATSSAPASSSSASAATESSASSKAAPRSVVDRLTVHRVGRSLPSVALFILGAPEPLLANLLQFSHVDTELLAIDFLLLESIHRLLGLGFLLEADESESLAFALGVLHDLSGSNLAVHFEQFH